MSVKIPFLSTEGYAALRQLANEAPAAFFDAQCPESLTNSLERSIATQGKDPKSLWIGAIELHGDLFLLNDTDQQSDATDALNAPALRTAFPAITAAQAADHRLWASINCFALLRYTTNRWNQRSSNKAPCRTSQTKKLREWVQEHYLGHGARMTRYNGAARLWWLAELASRASAHSSHSEERILSAMANNVEMYHQLTDRPFLASNSRLVAAVYDLALRTGNDYLLRRPYPNRMMQALSVKGAAVSLGALSDASLNAAVEEAAPPLGREGAG